MHGAIPLSQQVMGWGNKEELNLKEVKGPF
jgi:hypothetical protein